MLHLYRSLIFKILFADILYILKTKWPLKQMKLSNFLKVNNTLIIIKLIIFVFVRKDI